jgi:hypothetical protein
MQTFKLTSFPIEQVSDINGLEWRVGQWFAGVNYPVRLIATSRRFDMQAPLTAVEREQKALQRLARIASPVISAIDALLDGETTDPRTALADLDPDSRALFLALFDDLPDLHEFLTQDVPNSAVWLDAAACSEHWTAIANAVSGVLWPLPWLREMVRFFQALGEKHIRAIDHYMLTWEREDVSKAAIQSQLRHAFGREVQALDSVPSILQCVYRPEATRLVPDQPGFSYYAVLTSYEMRGTWDALTLHQLLDVPFDVSVLIDVQTLPRNKAMRVAETAYAASKLINRDDRLIDPRAQRVFGDSQRIMHELTSQALHLVTVAVLVGGETPEALEAHVAEIMGRLGTTLRLTRIAGAQDELIRLWSSTPTRRLDAPLTPWNMLSHGVGCCAGVVGYHRASETKGILWGLDARRRAPLFHDPFPDNQAGHMSVLGKTGSGKTWFLNQVTLRGAAIAGWKIIGIDAFRNGERIERAAGMGARCNWIGLESAVNILDVVYDARTEGGWISNQVQHVIGQLALLLGEPGVNAHGDEELVARQWTVAERGLLDQALTRLYATVDPNMPLSAMPILQDLIVELHALHEAETDVLARDLRLFLSGSMAASFNATTTVDWNVEADINYFDFSRVPETLRPFYYGQAVGAINRYMRDPYRDVRRRTLLVLDEFHYITRTEAVARMAAEIAKVARKYGIAVVAVDQNPATFLGNKYGQFIWENCSAKVLFHLDDAAARQVGDVISDLAPEHLDFLSHAQVGEALMIFGNDVYVAQVETNARETRAFAGS